MIRGECGQIHQNIHLWPIPAAVLSMLNSRMAQRSIQDASHTPPRRTRKATYTHLTHHPDTSLPPPIQPLANLRWISCVWDPLPLCCLCCCLLTFTPIPIMQTLSATFLSHRAHRRTTSRHHSNPCPHLLRHYFNPVVHRSQPPHASHAPPSRIPAATISTLARLCRFPPPLSCPRCCLLIRSSLRHCDRTPEGI